MKSGFLLSFLLISGSMNCTLAIDPRSYFFHAAEADKIFRLIGSGYDKKSGEVERITSEIDGLDIGEATENNRCSCFKEFCEELIGY